MVVVIVPGWYGTGPRFHLAETTVPPEATREMLPIKRNDRGEPAEPRQTALVELCLERPANARAGEPRCDDPQLPWWDLIQRGNDDRRSDAAPLDEPVLAKQLELPAAPQAGLRPISRAIVVGRSDRTASRAMIRRRVGSARSVDPSCGALRHHVMHRDRPFATAQSPLRSVFPLRVEASRGWPWTDESPAGPVDSGCGRSSFL